MQIPDFESIKQINVLGHEYWSARDLQKALGYESWQSFERIIAKAVIAATSPDIGLKLEDHFSHVTKMIELGKGAKREVKDYFLSRDACYFIAQNGDPEKPQIRAAQSFFVFTAKVYDMNRLRLEQERRLQLRLKVAEGNRQLAETAMQAGVQAENMPVFEDAGYVGMYHMTENQLSEFWNVPPGTAILDIMGPEALAANLFRITGTDEKLVRDQIHDETRAIATHHDVGAIVRKAVEEIHQQVPEDLPREASIRNLIEAERRKSKKRLKSKPPDDQETLF